MARASVGWEMIRASRIPTRPSTLPVGSSWCLPGRRNPVRYEAPQGRRVNALAAYRPYGRAPRLDVFTAERTWNSHDLIERSHAIVVIAEGVKEIERSTAKERHIILLTDGISEPGTYAELLPGLKKNNISVATVALGAEADFKLLKQVMRPAVDYLDHQMINDLKPFDEVNPSAENLSKYFYDETNVRLKSTTNGRVRVKDVTVFETDTTTATYSE